MKRILLLWIVLLFASELFSQVNKWGVPFITNYSPKQYKAHNENWMSVCNKYGVLFVANTNGSILEYDGKQWLQIPTLKKSIVYSLAIDTLGNVFAGSYGDFGKLVITKTGNYEYHSLSPESDTSINAQTFWKTYTGEKQEVYFCSSIAIYIYNHGKVTRVKLPPNSWLSFYENKKLYISNADNGIFELDNDYKLKPVKGGEFYKNKYIRSMNKVNSNQLLIFDGERFSYFNVKTGISEEIKDKTSFIQKYLIDKVPYGTCDIYNNREAWATIYGGLAVINNKWVNEFLLTDSTGLCSSTISAVNYNPIDGILWATTTNGIAKIEYSNPFRLNSSFQNLKGSIFNIKRYNNELYVATNDGLFKQINSHTGCIFKVFPELKEKSINVINSVRYQNAEHLWIGTENGISELYQNKISTLYKNDSIMPEVILQDENNPDLVYIGAHNGLWKSTFRNNKWMFEKINGISSTVIVSLIEDDKGNIWCGSFSNGVYCLTPENKIIHYTEKDGLPTVNDIFVLKIEHDVVFCTPHGLYFFDVVTNKIRPYSKLGNQFTRSNCNIISGYRGYNNQVWLNIKNRLYLCKPHYDKFIIDSTTFNRLPQLTIYSLYTEPSGITWIGTNEGLYSYDANIILPKNKFYSLIRQVKINSNDSIIFNGNFYNENKQLTNIQPVFLIPKLKYKYNNLTFTYAAPYFQDENNIQFSYYLDGFDEQWSKWTTENKANYTNISEGKYTFMVKARNVYLKESVMAEYSFEILPPWYRTVWAYIIYGILAIAIFIISIKLYTRKLEADKRRLEKIVEERTAEVVQQKNEIEEKNKEIEQKNKDITDSILYAKRIQEAILPPQEIAHIPGVEMFIYFKPKDIVSGDFYFMRHIKSANMLIVAAADCTGHGVPGAFMSMLGSSLLNEIVTKPEINHTDLVVNELRSAIIQSLNQEGKEQETKDGMDIAIVAYNYVTHILEFTGANNPLYMIRNNELIEYKADKMPVGLYDRKLDLFSRVEISVQSSDIFYIFSDGFADQFGGSKGKKYLYKRFKEFLTSIHQLPMEEQQKRMEQESINWRNGVEQIDDQLVIGIKIQY